MLILILTGLLFTASASQITGYGNKTAEYGKNAHYRCAVDNSTDVDQVTWQRLFKDDSIENLATYNKRFGNKVNDPYRLKVVLTEATLTSTSIALNNVTWADESCYICLFSVYLEESKQKRTCLKVRGISEVKTEARAGDEDDEEDIVDVEFSCSATGKPAPTIEWDYSTGATRSDLQQVNRVTNGDGTVTSSSNIVLEIPRGWTGHVDCLLNEGAVGQRRERIPFRLPDTKPEGGEQLSSSGVALVVAAVISLALVAAVAAAALARRRLKGSRRNEHV